MPRQEAIPSAHWTNFSLSRIILICMGLLLLVGAEAVAESNMQPGGSAAAANETPPPAQPQASTIHPSQALLLGYNLGVASVQSSVAIGNPADTASSSAKNYASVSIIQADQIAHDLNLYSLGQGGYTFSRNGDWVGQSLIRPNSAEGLRNLYNEVVVLRESHTAVFAKIAPRLANLYVLGVNVGIAEAQATQGEAARPLVDASLSTASEKAISVGLPSDPIENALAALRGGASLTEVHTMILSARSTYTATTALW